MLTNIFRIFLMTRYGYLVCERNSLILRGPPHYNPKARQQRAERHNAKAMCFARQIFMAMISHTLNGQIHATILEKGEMADARLAASLANHRCDYYMIHKSLAPMTIRTSPIPRNNPLQINAVLPNKDDLLRNS